MRPVSASNGDQPAWRCQLALRILGGAIRPTAVAYIHGHRLVATLRFGSRPIPNTLPTPDCREQSYMWYMRAHNVRLGEYVNRMQPSEKEALVLQVEIRRSARASLDDA